MMFFRIQNNFTMFKTATKFSQVSSQIWTWECAYYVMCRIIWSVCTGALCQVTISVESLFWTALGWCDGRDRIVVSTSRCGRDNPGSNPGHGRAVVSLSWHNQPAFERTLAAKQRDQWQKMEYEHWHFTPGLALPWDQYWYVKCAKVQLLQNSTHFLVSRLRGATVARLTPDQKVACSNHVGVKDGIFTARDTT